MDSLKTSPTRPLTGERLCWKACPWWCAAAPCVRSRPSSPSFSPTRRTASRRTWLKRCRIKSLLFLFLFRTHPITECFVRFAGVGECFSFSWLQKLWGVRLLSSQLSGSWVAEPETGRHQLHTPVFPLYTSQLQQPGGVLQVPALHTFLKRKREHSSICSALLYFTMRNLKLWSPFQVIVSCFDPTLGLPEWLWAGEIYRESLKARLEATGGQLLS